MIQSNQANSPNWKLVNVKSDIPQELSKLSELARNIWWSWNNEAVDLFESLDPELWLEVEQNPVLLLERMSYDSLKALANDPKVISEVNEI